MHYFNFPVYKFMLKGKNFVDMLSDDDGPIVKRSNL